MSQNSLLDLYAHPTVVARFSEMAALHPHREAIRDRFEVSTIGNSCIAPNNFQTIFSSIIRSREFVLECTANILESIVCLLAILLSGHHYLYIDLKQPAA